MKAVVRCVILVILFVGFFATLPRKEYTPRKEYKAVQSQVVVQLVTDKAPMPPSVVSYENTKDPEGQQTAVRYVLVRVSAYCPCARCCGTMDGVTAANTNAWTEGVAADWN